jgi:S1-C subfamily serine protease
MRMNEWPDDDASEGGEYPPAPLPAHERTWRHPSEVGRAVWTHAEPPITIGRGLLITTGAIGGLLSIAVLWAMLPSAGRGGIAAPTVVASTANDLQSTVITSKADTLVATSVDVRLTPTTVRTGSTDPATSDPITSTSLEQAPQTASQESELLQSTPVAVGVGDSLVITTARAVRGRTTITLTGNDGQPHDAAVLMVDRDRGIAVLSADAAASTTSYGIGPAANPGDVVTVMGSTPISASVSMKSDGHLTLDSWGESTPEGTPVVNTDGLLVGICSHGSSGNELVSVAGVAGMLAPVKPAPAVPWLGVHVVSKAPGALVIDWVSPDGPSAAVGLAVGDVVTAIDGVAVASVDELKAAIGAYAPADIITLTVIHADQTSNDVAITLGTAPSM